MSLSRLQTLLPEQAGGERAWGAVSNLDTFFQKVYEYHSEKGFWALVLGRVTNLLTLAFTIGFSTFLLAYVDWASLFSCQTADECSSVHPFRDDVFARPTAGEVIVLLYLIVFSTYWLWHLVSFFYTLRDSLEMRQFFAESLGLSDEELSHVEWSVVVERIVQLQERVRISIVKDLTPLDITNRIMRKENFMIALVNASPPVLRLSLPCLALPPHEREQEQAGGFQVASSSARTPLVSAVNSPTSPNYVTLDESPAGAQQRGQGAGLLGYLLWWNGSAMFGKVLEWNLKHCILDAMFDQKFTLREDFRGPAGARRLSRRFLLWGILNALLLPFIMLFMVIFFFLKHAEEFHAKRSYLGPRQWTPLAAWKIREFNELPHFFHTRTNLAHPPAQAYVEQFPSRVAAIVAQCLAYVSGAVVAILLVLMLGDSALLLTVRVWDRSLVWHLACFSAILAISRAFIPQKGVVFEPHKLMSEVVGHTHYLPASWRGQAHTQRVRDEFARLYKPRLLIFAEELVSVLVTPLILCLSLPRCAESIVQFIEESTVQVPGLGDICKYALFQLDENGDPAYSLQHSTSQSRRKLSAAPAPLQQGKLEKSFLSFCLHHPRYESEDAAGSRLLTRLAEEGADSIMASVVMGQAMGQGGLAAFLRMGGVASERRGRLRRPQHALRDSRFTPPASPSLSRLAPAAAVAAAGASVGPGVMARSRAKAGLGGLAGASEDGVGTEGKHSPPRSLSESDLPLVRSFADLVESTSARSMGLASVAGLRKSSVFAPRYEETGSATASILFQALEELVAEEAEEEEEEAREEEHQGPGAGAGEGHELYDPAPPGFQER